MKNILILLTVLLLSQSLISQISLDLEKSKIKWTGKKITNASHWGSLSFSEANLDFDGDDLVGGKFIVDMNSMSVDDIQGRGKQRLEGHLRNEDFFDVENHKEAILLFNERKRYIKGFY
jgi:polyisoprenoid-binding protein YceI